MIWHSSLKKMVLGIILILTLVIGYNFYVEPYLGMILFKSKYKTKDQDKFKLLVVWRAGSGERELISRYNLVTKKLGIEYRSVATVQDEGRIKTLANKYAIKHNKTPVELAIAAMRPDLIITMQNGIKAYSGAPNYRVLDQSLENYVFADSQGRVTFEDPVIYDFTGILTPESRISKLAEVFTVAGKDFSGMNWYPTSYATDYAPGDPKHLLYIGCFYGLRDSDKYAEVIKKLDEQGYLYVAGDSLTWKHTPRHNIGKIPFDGVALIKEFNKAGVALIFHDPRHLVGGTPTGRIFEAVAGNSVIISDRLAFIEENFGDNVLYVDIDQDAAGMFKQIDSHMQWILSHPKEAKQMADNCHKIFLEKFTLEAQLARLINNVRTTQYLGPAVYSQLHDNS